MSLQTGQIQETPGSPVVANYPLTSYCAINVSVPQAGSVVLIPGIGGLVTVGTEILCSCFSIMTGHIFPAGAANGALSIALSIDGVAVWDCFRNIWCPGNQITFFGPIHIAGYNMKITLFNDSTVFAQTWTGLLMFRSAV